MALATDEAPAVEEAASRRLSPDQFAVIIEQLEDGSDGATQLALSVDAGSLSGAVTAIDAEWARLRAAAGLAPAVAKLDFVVGPADASAPLHDMQLLRARELLRTGHPDHATVAAQTALEIYVRGLMLDLSRAVMPAEVARTIQPRRVSLRERGGREMLEALIGKRLTEAGDLWSDYDAHVRRRNGVVHDGARVDEKSAETSIRVVREFIHWLERVVQEG